MEINFDVDGEFWKSTNIVSRFIFVIAMFLIDLAMWLSDYGRESNKL